MNTLAEQLVSDGHPEETTIRQKQEEVNEAWQRLRQLSLLRQERLYGAHEIQRFNRSDFEITFCAVILFFYSVFKKMF